MERDVSVTEFLSEEDDLAIEQALTGTSVVKAIRRLFTLSPSQIPGYCSGTLLKERTVRQLEEILVPR